MVPNLKGWIPQKGHQINLRGSYNVQCYKNLLSISWLLWNTAFGLKHLWNFYHCFKVFKKSNRDEVEHEALRKEMSLSAGINIPVWCKPLLCHCTTLQTSCCRLWRSRWSPQRSSEQRQSGRDTVRCSKTGSSEIMGRLKKWTQPRTTWELRVTWVRVSRRAKIFCWPPVKYTLSILLSWSSHNKVWCQRRPTSTVMIPPFPHTGCVSLHLW